MNNPNNVPTAPNNAGIPSQPETLAQCYSTAMTAALNKLPKEEREAMLIKLRSTHLIVRGQELWEKDVSNFIKQVADAGEAAHERHKTTSKSTT